MSKANDIVGVVLQNLGDRKGFDWWWDDIDDETQAEIEEELVATIQKVLND